MPMEGFPAFDLPTLFVRAQLPGASARDIETKVSIPVEEAVEDLHRPGLEGHGDLLRP